MQKLCINVVRADITCDIFRSFIFMLNSANELEIALNEKIERRHMTSASAA